MIALILAAGKGSRISSIVGNRPKCLIQINGTSLIEKNLSNLTKSSIIRKIIIVINNQGDVIRNLIGDSFNSISVVYVVQSKQLGIIDALTCCINEIGEDDFLLTLSDEYFEYLDYHLFINNFVNSKDSIRLIAVETEENQKIRNNYCINYDDKNKIIKFVEKPNEIFNNLIGTGTIIFQNKWLRELDFIPVNPIREEKDLVDLLNLALFKLAKIDIEVLRCKYVNANRESDLISLLTLSMDYPLESNVIREFHAAVDKYRYQKAICYKDKSITYGELDILSDHIASNLYEKLGRSSKNIVGIYISRSIEYIICIFGILKAGMIYIPLDCMYPETRLNYIIENSHMGLVITEQITTFLRCRTITYEDAVASRSAYSYGPINSCDTAYIMYTSGSTGNPKGVMISHKNILNMSYGIKKDVYDLHKRGHFNICVIVAFVFDISAGQIYSSLLFGHTLYIMPSEFEKDGRLIDQFMKESHIHFSDGTPIHLRILVDYWRKSRNIDKLDLKHMVICGEKLPYKLAKDFFSLHSDIILSNAYGPTECCVEVTMYTMNNNIINSTDRMFIGYPMGNVRIYILDDNLSFLPKGMIGEIYIAGDCVGGGYYNNEKITKDSFLPDILDPTNKMYKSGDLGALGNENNIEFIGRKDKQVKIHGFRIELGEIECVLEEIKGVRCARVIAQKKSYRDNLKEEDDELIIVAYIQFSDKIMYPDNLRKLLLVKLPEYMLPRFFVEMTFWPKNINGKLDVEKLPNYYENYIKNELYEEVDVGISFETNTYEDAIIIFLKKTLQFKDIKRTQSICELGGDSLTILSILSWVYDTYQISLPVYYINYDTKIGEIADLIKKNSKKNFVNKKANRRKAYYVSYIQSIFLDVNSTIHDDVKDTSNMIYLIELISNIDLIRLEKVIKNTLIEFDCFNMKFQTTSGLISFDEEYCPSIEKYQIIDISDEKIYNICKMLNSSKLPTIQVSIILEEEKVGLLINAHHIIFDYMSLHILLSRIERKYLDIETKEITSYKEYLDWYRKNIMTKEYIGRCNLFFNTYLKGMVPTSFEKFKSYEADEVMKKTQFFIDEELTTQFHNYNKMINLSDMVNITNVFFTTLSKITGKHDLSVGGFMSGRVIPEFMNTIGLYANHVILRTNWDNNKSFKERGQSISRLLESILEYQFGFSCINHEFSKKINIIFDYHKLYPLGDDLHHIWNKAIAYDTRILKADFIFIIYDYGDKMVGDIKYKYDDETILDFINDFLYIFKKELNEDNKK